MKAHLALNPMHLGNESLSSKSGTIIFKVDIIFGHNQTGFVLRFEEEENLCACHDEREASFK
jgi:hypothetical protein